MGQVIPSHLPHLELVEDLNPVSADTAAKRAVVLTYFVGLGLKAPVEDVSKAIENCGLVSELSSREQSLLIEPMSDQDYIDCAWLTECLQALSWCFSDSELSFESYCDDDLVTKFPELYTDPSEFLKNAALRPFDQIYAMADLHYRYHWLSKESARQGVALKISRSAISERRRALDWIIGTDCDWDSISMDT